MTAPPLLAAVAAHGLPSRHAFPPAPPAPAEWRAIITGAEQHRLVGHLAGAAAAGDLALTDAQLTELARRDETWQGHALAMERLLIRVADVLELAGVELRVIKGPALAHTVYDDPAHRTFGDIDLVVAPEQLARARQALVQHLGGEAPLPELRPGFDAEFAKDVLVRVGAAEIDLHRTLAAGPFGLRVAVNRLMDDPVAFEVGGRRLATLGSAATFVHACYNAALGDVPPRLSSLRDVAQVDAALSPDPAAVADLTAAWGAAAVVQHAIASAWSTLELAPTALSRWAGSLPVPARDRRLLAASTCAGRGYTRQLASLAAIPGLASRLRYVRAIVAPSPEYLAARGWTPSSHLRRALRMLGRAGRGRGWPLGSSLRRARRRPA